MARRSRPWVRAVKKEGRAWGKEVRKVGREGKKFGKGFAKAGLFLITGPRNSRRRRR